MSLGFFGASEASQFTGQRAAFAAQYRNRALVSPGCFDVGYQIAPAKTETRIHYECASMTYNSPGTSAY
jgi:hypothetical protein